MPKITIVEDMENNYECEDITIEIFQYLPLRSMARMNCVSKFWQNYISNKSLLYSCRSSLWGSPLIKGFFFQAKEIWEDRNSMNFFSSSKEPLESWENSLNQFQDMKIQIIASSNGLLLCSRRDQNPCIHLLVYDLKRDLMISLPRPRNIFSSVDIGFHSEPNSDYSDSDSDYVSFTIVRYGSWDFSSIEIYSSETNYWKYVKLNTCEVVEPFFFPCESPSAVFLDGVFYWLESRLQIFAFDLLKNKFWKMECPPNSFLHRRSSFRRRLDVAGGVLQMTFIDGVDIEIWFREGKNCLWALRKELSVKTLIDNNKNIFKSMEVQIGGQRSIGILGFQQSDSWKFFLNTLEYVISYDLRSGKVELVYSFDKPCWDIDYFTFFSYDLYEKPCVI